MHLIIQFNHFNHALWVAVRCEASGASEATPAVAVASEDTCNYYFSKSYDEDQLYEALPVYVY